MLLVHCCYTAAASQIVRHLHCSTVLNAHQQHASALTAALFAALQQHCAVSLLCCSTRDCSAVQIVIRSITSSISHQQAVTYTALSCYITSRCTTNSYSASSYTFGSYTHLRCRFCKPREAFPPAVVILVVLLFLSLTPVAALLFVSATAPPLLLCIIMPLLSLP
jgi:hypothetical protein